MIRCEMEMTSRSVPLNCCASENGGSNQNQTDKCVCSFLESGGILSEQSHITLPSPNELLVLFAVIQDTDELPAIHSVADATLAPPELKSCWQFSFRTALSPRAPSFVS